MGRPPVAVETLAPVHQYTHRQLREAVHVYLRLNRGVLLLASRPEGPESPNGRA